ncbi:MAG: calcium/sodium antiporter [Deltaproteobacteria bacterium]|nr:MAG: calcium/sodium antiporter [Deltaproteobacteria bacterium]
MLFFFGTLVLGLTALAIGADHFVAGAASLAYRLKSSPLVVGLTVVSFGTSLPELLVTATAVLVDHSGVGLGNVLGSNISNICLVLGTCALLQPLMVESKLFRQDYPALMVATVAIWLMSANGVISRLEGLVLLIGLAVYLVIVIRSAGEDTKKVAAPTNSITPPPKRLKVLVQMISGLVLLLIGSRLVVWGGVELGKALGLSELIIGLTVVAVGTSFPELATSIAGVLKKQHSIAVGNVVGSNLINSTAIIGIPSILKPMEIESIALLRDYLMVFLASLALWPIFWSRRRGAGRVNRLEALLLLAGYMVYLWLLILF